MEMKRRCVGRNYIDDDWVALRGPKGILINRGVPTRACDLVLPIAMKVTQWKSGNLDAGRGKSVRNVVY